MRVEKSIELSVNVHDDCSAFCSRDCKFLKFYNPDSCYCVLRQCLENISYMDDLSINSNNKIYRSKLCQQIFCSSNEISNDKLSEVS